jgi:hypothetical protein
MPELFDRLIPAVIFHQNFIIAWRLRILSLAGIEGEQKARDNRSADERNAVPYDLAIREYHIPPECADVHESSFPLFY